MQQRDKGLLVDNIENEMSFYVNYFRNPMFFFIHLLFDCEDFCCFRGLLVWLLPVGEYCVIPILVCCMDFMVLVNF